METLKINTFHLANPSASLNKQQRDEIEILIKKLSINNSFKSLKEIYFLNINHTSFSVEVLPNSKGWRQALSDKICRELKLSHLKDPKTNRLFL